MLGLQVLFITPMNPPATRSAMPLTSDPTRRLAHSRMCDVPLANVCHQSAPLLLPLEYIVPNHLSDLSADSHGHAFTHRLPPTPSWIEHSEEQCRGVSYQVRTIDLRFRQFEKSFGRGPWHVVVSRNPARESNPPSQSKDSDAHRACSVSPFKDKISPPADGAARFYCAGDARVPRAPSPPRRPPLILSILVSISPSLFREAPEIGGYFPYLGRGPNRANRTYLGARANRGCLFRLFEAIYYMAYFAYLSLFQSTSAVILSHQLLQSFLVPLPAPVVVVLAHPSYEVTIHPQNT